MVSVAEIIDNSSGLRFRDIDYLSNVDVTDNNAFEQLNLKLILFFESILSETIPH